MISLAAALYAKRYISIQVQIYIYIYIERERERERENCVLGKRNNFIICIGRHHRPGLPGGVCRSGETGPQL